jgi:Mg-chelatase subunit ChlD
VIAADAQLDADAADLDSDERAQLIDWLLGAVGEDGVAGEATRPGDEEPDDTVVLEDEPDEDEEGGVTLDLAALSADELGEEENAPAIEADDVGDDADTGWSDSPADRDERIGDYDGDADHAAVREHLRSTGVMQDVRDALEELGETDEDRPAAEGPVLDMRNVTRRLAGDTTVEEYYRQRQTQPGDEIAVGVSLDMSGSMSSTELEAKGAVGAFLFAVQQAGSDVVANAWRTGTGQTTRIQQITGPYERFQWEHLDSVAPNGADPIARGVWECAQMLEQQPARQRLLVVITDGNPSVTSREDYGDGEYHNAVDEAEDTVADLRDRGLTVVGFGFGSVSEDKLERMFGADGYRYVDLEDLADALVDVFEAQHDRPGAGVPAA